MVITVGFDPNNIGSIPVTPVGDCSLREKSFVDFSFHPLGICPG